MIELILGGARSGKHWPSSARESGSRGYIATAQAGAKWRGASPIIRRAERARVLVEEPLHLAAALNDHARPTAACWWIA